MDHFAHLFVFNDLTPFSFRLNRKRHPGPHETASRPCRSVLKNSSRRPRVKKKSIVLPGAPSLDRRAFAAGGNRPNDPFNRIPYHWQESGRSGRTALDLHVFLHLHPRPDGGRLRERGDHAGDHRRDHGRQTAASSRQCLIKGSPRDRCGAEPVCRRRPHFGARLAKIR